MRTSMMVAALACGLILGCKPQDTPPPGPEPMPAPRALEPIRPDDELATSSPPALTPTVLPPLAPDRSSPTPPAPAGATRPYVLRKGDTFMGIARRELNNPSRYREIMDLNPGLEPSKLPVGREIRIPAR